MIKENKLKIKNNESTIIKPITEPDRQQLYQVSSEKLL